MMKLKSKYALVVLLAWLMALPMMGQVEKDVTDDDDETVAAADTLATDSLSADTLATDSLLPWPQSVKARIDRLLQADMLRTSQLGLMVYDLDTDSAIYCFNERQTMRPASTMKVITAITALDKLGGSHQFKTELCYTGTIETRTLTGNVYCVGGMDPRFNTDDMHAFVESLQKMGVDTIRGTLYADKSMKTTDLLGKGWCWDDDNPVLSALVYARKDVFMDRFMQELRKAGIVLDAFTATGQRPQDATCICTRFHTMDQVLMRMMKESDNLYAEAMFFQIAAATGNKPATAKNAAQVVKRLIAKLGLNAADYKVADGSGLSLYNYVSAELEVAMLRYAARNANIYLHLSPSLPIAGIDGTLKSRMKGVFTRGNVCAKTGSVTGVFSLAGYCTAANGHRLCFAIINQGVMRGRNARAFQDKICTALCQP